MLPEKILLNNLNRIPTIFNSFIHEFFFNAYYWQYFWVLILIVLVVFRKGLFSLRLRTVSIFCITSIAIYAFIYLIVPEKVYIFIDGTVDRLLLGLTPAISLLAFLAAFSDDLT